MTLILLYIPYLVSSCIVTILQVKLSCKFYDGIIIFTKCLRSCHIWSFFFLFIFLLCRWWKDEDVTSKLPYTRDRIVESYFPALGAFFEPQFSLGRIIATKIIVVLVVLNDTCDSYATYPEVKSLIDSLQMYFIHPLYLVNKFYLTVTLSLIENRF